MMALGNLFQTNFELGAPEAGWAAADQVRSAQQQQDLANAFQQLQNERYGQMTPLELQIKGLEAAQAGQLNTPEMLDLYGKAIGATRQDKIRANEIAALQHPLLKRLAELNLSLGTGEMPSGGNIGFPVAKQSVQTQVRQPQPGEVTLGDVDNLPEEQQVQIAKRLSNNLDILNNPKMPEITKQAARKDIEALQQQYPAPTQFVEQPVEQPAQPNLLSRFNGADALGERELLMQILMDSPEFRQEIAKKKAGPENKGMATTMRLLAGTGIPLTKEQAEFLGHPELEGQVLNKPQASTDVARAQRTINSANSAIARMEPIMKFREGTNVGLMPNLSTKDGMINAIRNLAGKTITSDEAKMMNTIFVGLGRELATVESMGLATGLKDLSDKMQAGVYFNPGEDNPYVVAAKLAEVRQIVEEHIKPSIGVTIIGPQAEAARNLIERVEKTIPFTLNDVVDAQLKASGGGRTIGDAAKEAVSGQGQGKYKVGETKTIGGVTYKRTEKGWEPQ